MACAMLIVMMRNMLQLDVLLPSHRGGGTVSCKLS
jgi:hypothetical protein